VKSVAFLLAAVVVASLAPAAGAAREPAERLGALRIALDPVGSSLQAGAVRGGEIVVAKGFEVALARTIARRLGARSVTFVNVSRRQLVAPGRKSWDLALAELQPRGRSVDFSVPYLAESHVVLLRRGLPRPRSLAALRGLQLCAERRTPSAAIVSRVVRPSLPPLLATDTDEMLRRVQTGACDAGLLPATELQSALAGHRDRFGAIAGRIDTNVSYAIALERGSWLTAVIDRALRQLRADGTLARLRNSWLGGDPLRLRVLR
jgi:ABC-type amino acid transport substrate-binding protein